MVASHLSDSGKLDEILKLFDSYKPRYSSSEYLKAEQKIPYKHLQIITTVLLKQVSIRVSSPSGAVSSDCHVHYSCQNTKEALEKLKELIKFAEGLRSEFGFNSKVHCIALALLQVSPLVI